MAVPVSAEVALLGAVLRDNRAWYDAKVTGSEFEAPSLGNVWDGIGSVIARGGQVDAYSLAGHFPAWGVRGVAAEDPMRWVDVGGMQPFLAHQYASSIRQGALRRLGRTVMTDAMGRLDDSGSDPAAVLTDVSRRFVEGQQAEGEIEAVELGTLLEASDEYRWVVPDLLEERDRLILTGAEGLGKSTMARQMILLPAAGLHPFTFEPIDPIRALVIDAENTAKQWKRNAGWLRWRAQQDGTADPAKSVHIATSGRVNLLDPRVMGSIHRLIDRTKPNIVFIGPLYRLSVRLNSDEDTAPVIAALDEIRDRGVALVIEAHAGHALTVGGIRDVRPRGSSALMGWPEFGFGLRRHQDHPEELVDFVPWRGAREQRTFPVTFRRGGRGEYPWIPDSWSEAA